MGDPFIPFNCPLTPCVKIFTHNYYIFFHFYYINFIGNNTYTPKKHNDIGRLKLWSTGIIFAFEHGNEKTKPAERQGRKATGL